MRSKIIIIFSFCVLLAACATPAPDNISSLPGHKAFEVAPISNATGNTFDFDVTSSLASLIKTKLREKEFSVTDSLENAILIKSSLTSYETIGTRTKCTVEIEFVDKKTQAVLDKIETSRTISVGGLSSAELRSDRAILEALANDIVFEIEKRIAREPQGRP